jgi:ATP-dependent DNA helicase 2 subunit 2
MLKKAKPVIEECQRAFNVKEGLYSSTFHLLFNLTLSFCFIVPKKVARQRKDGHVHAKGDDDEMLLLDRKLPQRTQNVSSDAMRTDIDTEGEEEEDLLLGEKSSIANHGHLPTPDHSPSPPIDPGQAPGRIIGSTYPLADFQKNIAQGDLVSKAVEDFGFVLTEIAMKPFASRRHGELLECMAVLRDVSLKVGIDRSRVE